MKTLLLFTLALLISPFSFADESYCAASVNGDSLKLEKSASGLLMIAIEDPHFDQWDVVIDNNQAKRVKIRAARFTDTAVVKQLKAELSRLSPELQSEVIGLAKARVVDSLASYDAGGDALLTLQQGDSRLDVYCHREESAP